MSDTYEDRTDTAALFTRDPRMWALRGTMFLILLGGGIVWVYTGIWFKSHGLGETAIGVLMGGGGLLAAGLGLFWGWLSDRTGRSTPIVAAGCILTGASLVVLAYSTAVPGFCLHIALVSAGMSATMTVMPLLALTVIGENRAGAGYGRFRIFGSLGYMVALYVLAALIPGLQRLFLWAGLLLILGVIPLLWANVQPRRHVQRHGFAGIWRHRALLRFLVCVFFFALGGPAVFTFLALYARELGFGQVPVARLMGLCGVVALVGLPVMGSLSDRLGAKWIMAIAFAAMPLRILTQACSHTLFGLYISQFFHFFTWAGLEVVMYTYVTELAGEQDRGVAVSAMLTVRTLSQLVANPIIGYLAERYGYGPMFGIMAGASSLGLILFCATELRTPAGR